MLSRKWEGRRLWALSASPAYHNFDFPSPPHDSASTIVKFRAVPVVIVGTLTAKRESVIGILAGWEAFGTPRCGSHHCPANSRASYQRGGRTTPHADVVRGSHKMASCPPMSLARGTSGTVPISLKKGNIVAPRIPIGPAYAQSVKVVFPCGFKPPHWTFGSLLFARLGWLFRDIQGHATQ
jgi:hypothetical protein